MIEKNILPNILQGETESQEVIMTPEEKSIKAYDYKYKKRYGISAVINPYIRSLIKEIIKKTGEHAPGVIWLYLHQSKPFYIARGHDLKYCLADLPKFMDYITTKIGEPIDLKWQFDNYF